MPLYRLAIFLVIMTWTFNSAAESIWDKPSPSFSEPIAITVYRSPTCGCCGFWLEHLKKHNFAVTDIKTGDVNTIKKKVGVSPRLASCHTAVVGDYVIEGHVPAGDIKKLLTEKPDVVGLSVPGMPHGTPGMEMSGRKDPFSVVSFDKNGEQQSYTDYLFY